MLFVSAGGGWAVRWQLQLFCKVGFCAMGFVCLANVLQCAVDH